MHITMVKKRSADGEPCPKCVQAEETLRSRGLWERIDEVIWADPADDDSPGMLLAKQHQVTLAPFFILETPSRPPELFTSTLRVVKLLSGDVEDAPPMAGAGSLQQSRPGQLTLNSLAQFQQELEGMGPAQIVGWAQAQYGEQLGIAFSGAEDVALIDMASKTGLGFRVFCLDTGRLHPQTYEFIEAVRKHYGVAIELYSPQASAVQQLVREKGLFSFYTDGHQECCGIRKVEPLRRALGDCSAWMTGQRRDQSPTRSQLSVLEHDAGFAGKQGPLFKFNPLAGWTQQQVWGYIRNQEVPYNALHDRGFVSVGCEPCTRPPRPGEHERAGRWWWEEATQRECGLHLKR